MKRIIYLSIAALFIFATSCKKTAATVATPNTDAMVNDWWVKIDGGTGTTFGNNYYNLSTYNTTDNNGKQMWFDDLDNANSFWHVQGVMYVDAASKTFNGSNIANYYYLSTFNLSNGIIIPKAAKSPVDGTVRDSIYFQISFSDDVPGVIHTAGGYSDPKFAQATK